MILRLLKIPLFVIIFIAIVCNSSLANKDLAAFITPNINKAFEGQKIKFTAHATGYDGNLHYSWSGGGTSRTKTYTIPIIESNTLDITCTVSDDDDSATGAVSITIAKIKLKEVSFSNNHTMRKDDSSIDYTAPHYRSKDRKYPVCFTRNTNMSASVKWDIDMGSITPTPTIQIKGDGPGNLDFQTTTATPNDGELVSGVMQCSSPFANEIDLMEPMVIKWSVSFDGLHWVDASSSNNTYVTLGDPLVSPLYETVVYLGCKNADGINNENALIGAIWPAFSGRNICRADGTPLTYYIDEDNLYDPVKTPADVAGLLKEKNGRCSAFQKLLINIFEVQGSNKATPKKFEETKPYLEAAVNYYKSTHNNHTPEQDGYPLGSYYRGNIFYIKNWNLTAGTANPTDLMGCAAQNNIDPIAIFPNHALVEIDGKIYDPSYGGNFYDSLDDWKATNVVGYGAQFMKENEDPYDFYLYVGETN